MINIDQSEVTAKVTKLMEAGNFGGASALLELASTNSTDTAKAETVAPLDEGKSGGAGGGGKSAASNYIRVFCFPRANSGF